VIFGVFEVTMLLSMLMPYLGAARELARSITAIENSQPEALQSLRDAMRDAPGGGRVIGITGPPGAGKSSLVDALARELRARDKTVAILAVDPSSRSTGGAILGDRIRMRDHYADPGIFIRSMATRGQPGGLAATTKNVAELLRVNGFDYVLIETVGVGQDEIAIAGVADIVAVVLVPGMGDDIQAIKAGVMEIADLYVVNKADYEGADRTVNEIEAMLNLGHGPKPAIQKTIATAPSGIAQLLEQLDSLPRRKHLPPAGDFAIDHIGIAVRSLDASARFYELLGLDTSLRETVPHEKVRVAMIPAGDSRIELLEALGPDSTIAKFVEKRGEGLHHVALRVPDLHRAIDALTKAGARVLHEPRRGAGGHLYTFIHPSSSGGVLWELIQA
jgi:LAO/AO transport system kinase